MTASKKKLLSEGGGLTFEKAIQIALSVEAAIEQENEIQSYQSSNIESANKLSNGQSSCCVCCGANTNIRENYPFKEKIYFFLQNPKTYHKKM